MRVEPEVSFEEAGLSEEVREESGSCGDVMSVLESSSLERMGSVSGVESGAVEGVVVSVVEGREVDSVVDGFVVSVSVESGRNKLVFFYILSS